MLIIRRTDWIQLVANNYTEFENFLLIANCFLHAKTHIWMIAIKGNKLNSRKFFKDFSSVFMRRRQFIHYSDDGACLSILARFVNWLISNIRKTGSVRGQAANLLQTDGIHQQKRVRHG